MAMASSSSAVRCEPTANASDSSSSSSSSSSNDPQSESASRTAADNFLLPPRADLPEGTALLNPGDPIEFWHAKELALGNYESPVPGRQSLAVRTESGQPLVIDAGQIVGLWKEQEMSGFLPRDLSDWTKLGQEARALLQRTPGRGLDLGPFWRAASSRGKGFVVTAADAAEYLFGEEQQQSRLGLKKQLPFQFSWWVGGWVGDGVPSMSLDGKRRAPLHATRDLIAPAQQLPSPPLPW